MESTSPAPPMTAAQHAQALIVALSPAARLARAAALNRAAEVLALAGLRLRHPHATPHMLGVALALQRIGRSTDHVLAARLTKETTMGDTALDFLAVAVRAARRCTDLGIPYLIGGGIAATVHGEFRTTRDVDLIVRLTPADAPRFALALAADFILHPPDVQAALMRVPALMQDRRQRATFVAYDRATGYQLDVFCTSDSPYDRSQFTQAITIAVPDQGTPLRIASAEDTILTKLEWYTITPSDRQWDDVQAILRTQGATLDRTYLERWTGVLGVDDLWDAAQRGAGVPHQGRAGASADDPRQMRMEL